MKTNKVRIFNNQSAIKINLNSACLKRILLNILKMEGKSGFSLNFVFVDNHQIRKLNRAFLKKNRITDVIAFGYDNQELFPTKGISGDIAVCAEVARRKSKELNIDFNKEVLRYCIHGLLHILGYDDLKTRQKTRMWEKQEYYLSISLP